MTRSPIELLWTAKNHPRLNLPRTDDNDDDDDGDGDDDGDDDANLVVAHPLPDQRLHPPPSS